MKSPLKHIATLFGTIALAAVMVTFFIACKDDPGDNKPTSGTGFYEGFEYSYDAAGVTIEIYSGSGGNVVIPATIDGKPVISIGDKAFDGYRLTGGQLTSVTIPNSVKTIGERAFMQNQLTSVIIPNSVTYIGEWAFAQNQLTSVTIGNGLTYIGEWAFRRNNLTSVTIPNSVKTIGDHAFTQNQLTSVTIGNGLTYIGESAFDGSSDGNQLTSVTIPDSVTYIGAFAFSGNQLTNVTIGSGVTSIGEGAFASNKLTELTLAPGNTAYIVHPPANPSFLLSKDGKQLLMHYGTEQSVTIPASVTSIMAYAFYAVNNNYRLTSVTFDTNNSVTEIGEEAFSRNELTNVTIPAGVTIGVFAFASNQSLTSVTIGDNVTIKAGAFGFCNELTSITMGTNVTIDNNAFSGIDEGQNSGFESVFNITNNKAAGTYTGSGDFYPKTWSKSP
jgi:serine acetyltransferase